MTGHFCPECGKPLGPADHFCAECGHHLDVAAGSGAPTEVNPPVAPAAAPPAAPAAAPYAPVPPSPVPPAAGAGGAPPFVGPYGATGPVAPPPASRSKAPWLIGLGVFVVLLLIGGIVAVLTLGGDDDGEEVFLEATAVDVEDPFTSTVAVDETPISARQTSTGSTVPAAATGAGGGAVKGSAPGLYGGTRDAGSCDREKLISFLQSEPAKASAWAGVHGIAVASIPDYVRSLTPVILRRDTRVVNHGYRAGKATPRAAVLQAGTAVLVDDRGIPRVKCGCGNPLAEARPVTTNTRYVGNRWGGFEPTQVVVVRVDVKVEVLVLIDIETGLPFSRPIGTEGADDADAEGTAPADDEPAPVDSEGTSAPVLFEITSIAGVSNNPTSPSVADLPAARVTAISTYHWNDAQGAEPGELSLRGEDGTVYGPFPTTGSEGQGGVPNASWTAITNFHIPAGAYTVVDSDPGTWAWAPDTGGRGMVTIWGVADPTPATTTAPPRTTAPPHTTAPPTTAHADRGQEAINAVESLYCPSEAGMEDWTMYITETRAYETDFELYRVEVDITLDSGAWTALFDVDFATEDFPNVQPVNSDSASLIC